MVLRKCLLILVCITFCFAEISQIHLALTGDPTEMVVSWWTRNDSQSIVQFGFAPGDRNLDATGESITYHPPSGYIHNVKLQNLLPSTRYYYAVGDGVQFSNESYFKTAPADTDVSFTIGVYGDMGVRAAEESVKRVNNKMKSGEWDFVYHLGDISYADHYPDAFDETWDAFFTQLEDAMKYGPYMAIVGNNDWGCTNNFRKQPTRFDIYKNSNKQSQKFHFTTPLDDDDFADDSCTQYASNYTAYKYRFRMPGEESGSNTNMYFSFNYGPVHFIAISTETNFPGSDKGGDDYVQLKWLEQDLIEATKPENRALRPWIIVGGHRPMYSSILIYNDYLRPIGECETIQNAFEPLFHKYGVDIFFNGHVHGYERNWPVYDSHVKQHNYIEPEDTIHIMSGAAGDIEGMDPLIAYSPIDPKWLAFRYASPAYVDPYNWECEGYGQLTVQNKTHLLWQFYDASDDTLIDHIQIVKHH